MSRTLKTTKQLKSNSLTSLMRILTSSVLSNIKYIRCYSQNKWQGYLYYHTNYQTEYDTNTDQINNDTTTSAWGCSFATYCMLLNYSRQLFRVIITQIWWYGNVWKWREKNDHRKYVWSITHSPHTSILCP